VGTPDPASPFFRTSSPPPSPMSPDHFEPVLSTEAMRQADRRTIEAFDLPGRVLMETAGRGVCDVLERVLGPASGRRVLVLCGTGNNGGDGLVIARVLHARGAEVHAVALADEGDLTEDAAANLRALHEVAAHAEGLRLEVSDRPDALNPYWPEVVVDALLGIGVTGPLREPVGAFARWVNACPAPAVAVDVPSGLDSETGRAAEGTVRAALTVTMAARKPGHLFGEGPEHCGRVEAVDIGVPPHLLAEASRQEGSGLRSTDAAVRDLLPRRAGDAHKYTAGRVLAVAGSRAFPGAAVLTATAAARAGAGAVVLAVPEAARPLVLPHLTEVMTAPMPDTPEGTFGRAALDPILERARDADALVLGPGLGRVDETQALLRRLLPRLERPAVLDADGLTALAGHTDLLRQAAAPLVLTPHLGELRRLAGTDDLDEDRRIRLAVTWAQRWNVVLVVKGMPSVVGTPEGRAYVSAPASPALATAGTGDVLAGMIAGLLAQGVPPAAAALCALHVGGRAAERYARRRGVASLLASDLLREVPYVLYG
jgi:ADP-dependent NAD(P)H-hydrate dehydratase / NAD(P)H-hydrate epimerase